MGEQFEYESSEASDDEATVDELASVNVNAKRIAKRGHIHFITPRILSALDNAKISNGKAMHILVAAAEGAKLPVDDLILNYTTLHRLREEHRRNEAENIQAEFIENVIYF